MGDTPRPGGGRRRPAGEAGRAVLDAADELLFESGMSGQDLQSRLRSFVRLLAELVGEARRDPEPAPALATTGPDRPAYLPGGSSAPTRWSGRASARPGR